jgi:hypothetical protein
MSFGKVIHDMYEVNQRHEKPFNVLCTCLWGLHTIRLYLKDLIKSRHQLFIVGAYVQFSVICMTY